MSREQDRINLEKVVKVLRNPGEVPVVAPSDYKTDGTWVGAYRNSIYNGQLAINVADSRIWYRSDSGITEILDSNIFSGGTAPYVLKAGDTMTGDLNISGARIDIDAGASIAQVISSAGYGSLIRYDRNGGSYSFYTGVDGASYSRWSVYNSAISPLLTVLSSGKVGIGTNSPSYKLDVNGDTRIVSGLELDFLQSGLTVVTSSGGTIDSMEVLDVELLDLTTFETYYIDVSSSTYTLNEVVDYDEIILHITTGSTITIDTDQLSNNSKLTFKVAGNYSVIVDTEGAETIDGETEQTLSSYNSMVIYPRNSNWWIK